MKACVVRHTMQFSFMPVSWLVFSRSFQVKSFMGRFFILARGFSALGLWGQLLQPWHKQEQENILRSVGIRVERGEPIRKGLYRGSYKTIGDPEHMKIIELYVEDELSIGRIAEKLGRSNKSVHDHVKHHNSSIERSGFCPKCRRAKSEHEKTIAKRQ